MRNLRVITSLILALASLLAALEVMARGWEPLKAERTDVKLVVREAEVEIKSAPGVIVVTTSHQVPIKIFTILGRLVSSETLPQGSMQFLVPAHGVYIVKAGDLTCKVAV